MWAQYREHRLATYSFKTPLIYERVRVADSTEAAKYSQASVKEEAVIQVTVAINVTHHY